MRSFILLSVSCLFAYAMQAQIIHVPADYPTIQQGIQAANPGDTVLVADDTYYEQINFLGKPITVASEFIIDGDQDHIDNTIIDGSQIPAGDSCSVVYFINDEDTTSVLCGFRIQNGLGTYLSGAYTIWAGGGIFISNAGAKIVHNHITENHLSDTAYTDTQLAMGAGVIVYGNDAVDNWVIIDHNVIDQNSLYSEGLEALGAGFWIDNTNAVIVNNVISGNTCTAFGSIASAPGFGAHLLNDGNMIVKMQSNIIENNIAESNSFVNAACGTIIKAEVIFTDNLVQNNTSISSNGSISDIGGIFDLSDPLPGTIIMNNTFKENSTTSNSGGIFLRLTGSDPDHETVMVENNYFQGNDAANGGAFYSRNVPVLLQNNVFSGNHAGTTGSGGAVYFQKNLPSNNPHLLTVVNSTFSGNYCGGTGGAIRSSSQVDPLIINSIFWNNTANTGPEIYMSGGDSVEIAYTDIDMSLIYGGTTIDGGGNINVNPLFEDMELLTLANWSPCVNSGTEEYTCQCGQYYHCPLYDINGDPRPMDGLFDMGAYEVHLSNVIHIPADYDSIQQGIDAALPGDLVLVSDGTYYEQINFLGKAITVASEFIIDGDQGHIDSTIIDGSQAPNPDSASVVYFINGEDTTSVLCGFTIQGGHGTLMEYARAGGGIYCLNGASISNNIIQNNQISVTVNGAWGGGILASSNSPVHIINSTIRNNLVDCQSPGQNAAAGGALALFASNTYGYRHTVSGNLIEENEARTSSSYLALGGGIAFQEVAVLCENNIFKNNVSQHTSSNGANGGAMHWWICLEGSCIRNNSFEGNTAENYGGAMSAQAADSVELLIESNYFEGNSGTLGGGLCTWNSKLLIQNNVFNSNLASNQGGACYFEYDVFPQEHKSVLMNNSFYNNHASVGGAILSIRTKPLILNSIFWNDTANTGPEIHLVIGDSVEIAYSDIDMSLISGGTIIDGGGNIPGSDPLFMSPDFLMLSGGSPCIDQGTDTYTCNHGITYNCPEYDILNTPRPMDDGFDMGAYEWYLGVGIEEEQSTVSGQRSMVRVYPNPTGGSLQFAVRSSQEGQVMLKLYDIHGREVATLLDEILPAGEHSVQFDASGLPAGIYVYRFAVGGQRSAVGKLVKY